MTSVAFEDTVLTDDIQLPSWGKSERGEDFLSKIQIMMFRRFIRSFEIKSRFHGFSRYAVYRYTSNIIIVSSVTDII